MAGVTRPTGELSVPSLPSPYVELDRDDWARLRNTQPMSLNAADLDRLSGLNEPINLREVEEVYLPISRLLNFYVGAMSGLHRVTSSFLGERPAKTPFIIGVAGSVAVGKSTTARVLRELLSRWEDTPHVELVTTDGFLLPNEILKERGLLERKGFPESYDRRALIRFVSEVKSGKPEVTAPVYSHLTYDIVPDKKIVVHQPDVLIVEGLNVLQPSTATTERRSTLALSDFFDFSVYVDARERDIRKWYVNRFLSLRETAFADPNSYFHRFASFTDEEAVDMATKVWESINYPNLVDNIAPTRGRATLVMRKAPDHTVQQVLLRKL